MTQRQAQKRYDTLMTRMMRNSLECWRLRRENGAIRTELQEILLKYPKMMSSEVRKVIRGR